ncbi:MAG TPA: hypothetical protein ENH85_03215 [Candidatus Scalindua sp.]|nr:hypothetical protein [Candidatus Scalindua sp.]
MPYIKKAHRPEFDYHIIRLVDMIDSWRDFDYVVSKMLNILYANWGLSYNFINNAMGALSCIQAEFYRTIGAPYEDKKRSEHGEV